MDGLVMPATDTEWENIGRWIVFTVPIFWQRKLYLEVFFFFFFKAYNDLLEKIKLIYANKGIGI